MRTRVHINQRGLLIVKPISLSTAFHLDRYLTYTAKTYQTNADKDKNRSQTLSARYCLRYFNFQGSGSSMEHAQ